MRASIIFVALLATAVRALVFSDRGVIPDIIDGKFFQKRCVCPRDLSRDRS
jgi:hypothetical protein